MHGSCLIACRCVMCTWMPLHVIMMSIYRQERCAMQGAQLVLDSLPLCYMHVEATA